MKGVIYARVSRRDENIENQLLILRNFAEKHGIEVIEEFPEVISGYDSEPERREKWSKAVSLAEKENCVILVFSLDRISRRYDHLVRTLERLSERGVQVISYQEEWLSSLASIPDESLRKLIFDIIIRALAYSYQKYVESIIEKTKAGIRRAKAQGKHVGRPYKISDEEILRLIKRYPGLSIKDLWRIARGKGYSISYSRFWVRVRELRRKKKAS